MMNPKQHEVLLCGWWVKRHWKELTVIRKYLRRFSAGGVIINCYRVLDLWELVKKGGRPGLEQSCRRKCCWGSRSDAYWDNQHVFYCYLGGGNSATSPVFESNLCLKQMCRRRYFWTCSAKPAGPREFGLWNDLRLGLQVWWFGLWTRMEDMWGWGMSSVSTCLKCEGSQAVEQLSRESVRTDCSVTFSEIWAGNHFIVGSVGQSETAGLKWHCFRLPKQADIWSLYF